MPLLYSASANKEPRADKSATRHAATAKPMTPEELENFRTTEDLRRRNRR